MNKRLPSPLLFRLVMLAAVCLLLTGLVASAASANGVSPYSVSWYSFDGGGGVSSSPGYSLMGTIGQPDAGHYTTGSGGPYDLTGGFWVWVGRYLNFVPLIKKP